MSEYFYTATDQSGKRKTECIQAGSTEEALRKLESADYNKIVLYSDDFATTVTEMMPDRKSTDARTTTTEQGSLRMRGDFEYFVSLAKYEYWQSRWAFLIGGIVLSFVLIKNFDSNGELDFFASRDLRLTLLFSLLGLLIPSGIALKVALFSPPRKLNQMLEACYWGRWNEVLQRLPQLQKQLPPVELRGREAAALAGLGKLDEALKIMKPFEDSPDIPHWMYLIRLSEFYEYVGQPEQSVKCFEQAYEEEPENPLVQLSYANTLLKFKQDQQLAHKLIQLAEAQPLSDFLEIVLPLTKGLLELNLEHYRFAFYHLVETQNRLQPLLHAEPFARLYADIGRAYAAIALAELGEMEEAETLFQSALHRLQALNSVQTMERYQLAVKGR